MALANAVRGLGPIDVKSVLRDSMLRWMFALPVLVALLMRWGVPAVANRLRLQFGFELEPYYALITSFMILISPMLVGVVIGFLLLDQRDDGTLAALQVTPLSLNGYLVYRVTAPILIGAILTMVVIPIAGLVEMGPLALVVVAIAAAPFGPLYALFLAGYANNKVQGFALMKAAGILSWPPIIAYFLPIVWQWIMGIVPTYWPVKVFWMLEAGESGWLPYLVIGIVYQALLMLPLLRRFNSVASRQT
jgi:fluoroquinolone transport system permease protein